MITTLYSQELEEMSQEELHDECQELQALLPLGSILDQKVIAIKLKLIQQEIVARVTAIPPFNILPINHDKTKRQKGWNVGGNRKYYYRRDNDSVRRSS